MILSAIGKGATTAWSWVRNNPIIMWIIGIAVAVIGLKIIEHMIRESGRRDQRLKQAVEAAKEQAQLEKQSREIAQERTDDRQTADEDVAALPEFTGVERLREQRPDLHALIFGAAGTGTGGAES